MDKTVPIIELKGITKSFGSFRANDEIDLKIHPGEIHAILGENGAGKSTLMNIIYGMYKQDKGTVHVDGKEVHIRSPKDALKLGIGMVHQHYMLVDVFSGAENTFLIGEDRWWKWKKDRDLESLLQEMGEKYGLSVDAKSQVDKLTVGMQQRIEILKLLYIGARVLILDEPTAVLAPQECEILFDTIKALVEHGKSVVFISHKLDEVLSISNRITVLNKGRIVGAIKTEEADKATLIRMMVGSDVSQPSKNVKVWADTKKRPLLQINDAIAVDDRGVQTLGPITLNVGYGEIVGIAGVEGNGQAELAEIAAGYRRIKEGSISIEDKRVDAAGARNFIDAGVAYVPADRNEVGSVKKFPLYENWILRRKLLDRRFGLLDYKKISMSTENAINEYDVRTSGISARTGNLSGGNLQKLILAREMSKNPKVLVCSYPTRGLDIKATWFIREKIIEGRNRGLGVLLVSGDLDELFFLSDRLIVLYRGQIIGELIPSRTTVSEVGMLMMGVKGHEAG